MGASGLGSLLVKEGFLTEQDRLTITKTCGQGSWAFAKSIVAMGLLDEDELAAFFAERTRYQIAPKDFLRHLDQDAVQSFDRRLVSKLEMIPLKRESGKITVGVVDPLDRATLKQLEFFTGLEVNPVVVPLSQLYEGLTKIDPDFRREPTALSHFLQNHAQSAWVRQKLDSNELKLGRGPAPTTHLSNSGEDLFEEVTEIEELDDEAIEMEDLGDDEMSSASNEESTEESFDSFERSLDTENETREDEIDPFGGTSELSDSDDKPVDSEMPVEDLDPFGSDEDEDDRSDSLFDRLNVKEDVKPRPTNQVPDHDFEQPTDILLSGRDDDEEGDATMETKPKTDDFSVEEDSDLAFDDGVREDDDTTPEGEADIEGADISLDENYEMPEVSTFGFEETKPRGMPSQTLNEDFGVPEDAKEAADGQNDSDIDLAPSSDDLLDSLADDREPTLDISTLPVQDNEDETRLFADLAADEDEMPLSRIEGPAFTMDEVKERPAPAKASAFDDDEETNINLYAARRTEDDDDIRLYPKADREQKDSGLNPTSTLNEMILKLSLSFSSSAARETLETYLPTIGPAGCLVNSSDQRQFLWSNGRLMSEQLGPAAIHPMLNGLEDKKWKSGELKASESWTGKSLKVRLYRDGNWLWAHSLNEGNDSAIFRETVESAVNQATLKLGAG